MIERAVPSPDSFAEYVRLLRRLHWLIAEGKGESDEAEELRDRMDAPWRELTAEELDLVDGLSAQLYSIGQDRPEPVGEPAVQLEKKFTAAVDRCDWRGALAALAAAEWQLTPALVARLRATCWMQLRQFDVAIEFFKEEERLEPLAPTEAILLLFCLVRENRIAESEARMDSLLASNPPPRLILAVGTAISLRAVDLDANGSADWRRRAIEFLKVGLEGVVNCSWKDVPRNERVGGYLHLAANCYALGDSAAALAALSCALDLDPNNLDALQMREQLADPPERDGEEKEIGDELTHRLSSYAICP